MIFIKRRRIKVVLSFRTRPPYVVIKNCDLYLYPVNRLKFNRDLITFKYTDMNWIILSFEYQLIKNFIRPQWINWSFDCTEYDWIGSNEIIGNLVCLGAPLAPGLGRGTQFIYFYLNNIMIPYKLDMDIWNIFIEWNYLI